MGFRDPFASVRCVIVHGVIANLGHAFDPGLDFALNPQAHQDVRPNRVRNAATDYVFASGCSPPHLAVTQLPSDTGNGHFSEEDFHLSNRACSQAHGFRLKAGRNDNVKIIMRPLINAFGNIPNGDVPGERARKKIIPSMRTKRKAIGGAIRVDLCRQPG